VTPKDLLYKVVAKGRPLDSTPVAEVMTADPDVMSGSATAVQALLQLQRGGYRNLPVVSESGDPLGVLDVIALIEGSLLLGKEAEEDKFTFKVILKDTTIRITSTVEGFADEVYSRLLACVPSGLLPREAMRLHTEDEEGDALLLATDKDVQDSISVARRMGLDRLVVQASFIAHVPDTGPAAANRGSGTICRSSRPLLLASRRFIFTPKGAVASAAVTAAVFGAAGGLGFVPPWVSLLGGVRVRVLAGLARGSQLASQLASQLTSKLTSQLASQASGRLGLRIGSGKAAQ